MLEFFNDRIAITPNVPEIEGLLFGAYSELSKADADADAEWDEELSGPAAPELDDAAMTRVLGKFASVFEAKLLELGGDADLIADAVAELVEL